MDVVLLNIAVLQIPVHYRISARLGNVVCKYILPPTGSLIFTPQSLSAVGKKTDVSYDANSHVLNDTMRVCALLCHHQSTERHKLSFPKMQSQCGTWEVERDRGTLSLLLPQISLWKKVKYFEKLSTLISCFPELFKKIECMCSLGWLQKNSYLSSKTSECNHCFIF